MEIRLMANEEELLACAEMMHTSAPWTTLQLDMQQCIQAFKGISENYVMIVDDEVAGFAILQMKGPFSGYIRSICIAGAHRNKKLGEQLIAYCEHRIWKDSPNVFLCVSSFNDAAQRFYYRRGYEKAGVLKDLLVHGHDEYLLRKTTGPRLGFKPSES